MENLYKWLVLSSENPEKASLTIKGFLIMVIPFVITISSQLGIHLAQEQFMTYITQGTTLLSALLTVYGLTRKLLNTMTNKETVVFTVKKKSKKVAQVKE